MKSEFFKLEDRVLFEAAAVAEIVEAQDVAQNDPNANVSESEKEAQEAKEAQKNAPPENPVQAQEDGKNRNPDEAADVDAQAEQLLQGDLPEGTDLAAVFADGEQAEDGVSAEADDSAFIKGSLQDNGLTVSTEKELVVINSSVADKDVILAELKPDQEVLILEEGNGMDEVLSHLEQSGKKYAAIHFITHGNEGALSINGELITAEKFNAADWTAVGEHLTEKGDILFYGCNVAGNSAGQELVTMIAEASGADVSASADSTGVSGNWFMEYTLGTIESETISVEHYQHNLITYIVSNLNDSGSGSLRQAITDANANAGTDEITFTLNGTIKFNSEIKISDDVAIIGNGVSKTIFDGQAKTRLFVITEGNSVRIEKATFSNAYIVPEDYSHGAAVSNEGTLTLSETLFKNNSIGTSNYSFYGAAVGNKGTLNIIDSTFTGNKCESTYPGGGAIYNDGTMFLINSTITGNRTHCTNTYASSGNGSGIYNTGTAYIANSIVAGNKDSYAGLYGNDIDNLGDEIYVYNSLLGTVYNLQNDTASTVNVSTNDLFANDGTLDADGKLNIKSGSVADGKGVYVWHNADYSAIAYSTTATGTKIAIVGTASAATLQLDNFNSAGKPNIGSGKTAEAASLEVTTTEDVINAYDNLTSLREAVTYAAGLSGSQTITFGVNGIFELDSEIALTSNITIRGNGAGNTILDGQNSNRIFNISSADAAVSITGMTLQNGKADEGGAIYNVGTLTVDQAIFRNNTSTSTNVGGGAIRSLKSLTVSNSEFISNSATWCGGAIFATENAVVENSLFSENNASRAGGVFYITGSGQVTIKNSTFSNNSAGNSAGAIYNNGSLKLLNSTLSGNVAGINGGLLYATAGSTSYVVNSILVGNGTTNDLYIENGGNFNLYKSLTGVVSGTLTTNTSSTVNTAISDVFESVDANGDALLDSDGTYHLKENGLALGTGVFVWHNADYSAIAYSSKTNGTKTAVLGDTTNATILIATDQLGQDRNTLTDIGAYEMSQIPIESASLVVTTTSDIVDAEDGVTSLREAVSYATSLGGAQEITFAVDGTFLLNSELALTTNVTITGNGANKTILDGQNSNRIFNISSADAAVSISGMTLQNGKADDGGAIYNIGTLTVDQVIFRNNTSTSTNIGGGAIRSLKLLTVSNSEFISNSAAWCGGAIFADKNAVVENSLFSENNASRAGGVFYIAGSGQVTIKNSTFSNNSAGNSAGAIYNNGSLKLLNSTLSGNVAGINGGLLYATAGSTSYVVNSILVGNGTTNDLYIENGGNFNLYKSLTGVVSGTLTTNTSSTVNTAISDVFESVDANGDALLDSDGTYHLKAGGSAFRTGVFVWHNADYSAIACSATADGTKTDVLGDAVNATMMIATDQLGQTRTAPTDIGAVIAEQKMIVLDPASADFNCTISAQEYDGTKEVDNATITVTIDGIEVELAWDSATFNSANVSEVSTATFTGLVSLNPAYVLNTNTITVGAAGKILARELAIKADNAVKTSGKADPTFTWQLTSGELVDGDMITGSLSREAGEELGQNRYAITQGTLSAGSNYTISFTEGTLSVKEAPSLIVNTIYPNAASDYDGKTSLYEAVKYANSLTGESTITFAVDGTFKFSSAMYINGNVTIIGNGDDKTIFDGNGNSRLFYIYDTAEVTISNVTIQNGYDGYTGGGAILNYGTSTLANIVFTNNKVEIAQNNYAGGGAIYNTGTLTVDHCDFTDNNVWTNRNSYYLSGGGAIFNNAGMVKITDSSFENNLTTCYSTYNVYGGAIFNYSKGSITVERSSFVGNNAKNTSSDGSGTLLQNGNGFGGAIYNYDSNLVTINCSFADNGASKDGGAIYSYSGIYIAINNTFTGNHIFISEDNVELGKGSAVFNDNGTLRLVNNIIVGNNGSNEVYGTKNIDINNLYAATGVTVENTFAEVDADGNAILNADGTFHLKTGGKAHGKGVFVWHNADYSAIACSATADGTKTAVLGDVADATILISTDQLGQTRTAPTDIGAVIAEQKMIVLDPASADFNCTISAQEYDGTKEVDNATITVTIDGIDVELAWDSATFNSANVSEVSTATFTGLVSLNPAYVLSTDMVTVNAAGKITAKNIMVTANAQSKVYGEADPTLTYKVSGLVNGETEANVLSGTLTRTTGENVGTYAIKQGTLKASDNYNLVFTGGDLTITKATVTVTADSQSKFYGTADPTLSYQVTGLVGGDTLTGELTRDAGEDVGTYAITQGTLAASSNYDLVFTGADLTIAKATVTVTANAQSKVYGTADPSLTYNVTGLVGSDTLTGELSRAVGENVGIYAITKGTLAASSNYDLVFNGANLTINQKVLSVDDIVANITEQTYDGDTALDSATLTIDGVTVSWTNAAFNSANVKEVATATFSGLTVDSNYALSADTVTVDAANKILAKEITVSGITASNKIYDGNTTATVNTIGATFTGMITGDNLTVSTSGTFGDKNVGTGKTVTFGALTLGGTDADNYILVDASQKTTTADVTVKEITVIANAVTQIYGDAEKSLTYQVEGLVENDALSGTLMRATGKNVGTYTINSGTLSNSNYTIKFTEALYTITKRDLTITATDILNHTYGTAYTLSYTSSMLGAGDAFTGALEINPEDNGRSQSGHYIVGDHIITKGSLNVTDSNGIDMSANYTIHFNTGILSVVKAEIQVAAVSVADKIYDGTIIGKMNGWNFNSTVANSDALILSGTATFTDKHAGVQKTATVSNFVLSGADAGNYTLVAGSELYTTADIAKADISIILDNAAKEYGSSDPGFTVKSATGLKDGDRIIDLGRSNTGENVGSYSIDQYTISDGNGGNNYNITNFTAGTLTISSKVLKIAINDTILTYDGSVQYAASYTAEGLENGDNISSLSVEGVRDAGVYSIAATDVTIQKNGVDVTDNYTISFVRNINNVKVNTAKITVTAKSDSVTYGTAYTLTHDGTLYGTDQFSGSLALTNSELSSSGHLKVGEYTIEQGTLTAGSNYEIIFETGKLTVSKADLSVSAVKAADRSYNGTDVAVMMDYTFNGLFSGDKVTLTGSGAFSDRHAGNDKIVSFSSLLISGADCSNYNLLTSSISTKATITKAVLGFKAEDSGKGYGSSDPVLLYRLTEGELYGADTITMQRQLGENVGDYSIDTYIINDGNNGNNYDVIDFTAGIFTIGAKSAEINVGTTTVSYNGNIQHATEYTISGLERGHTVNQIVLGGARNAGIHSVTVEDIVIFDALGNDVTANYGFSFSTGNLVINQAQITVTATPEEISYGENATGAYTYIGTLYGSDVFSGNLSIAGEKNSQGTLFAAGVATFKQGDLTINDGNDGKNYNITFNEASLTISAKEISLSSVGIQDKIYDGTTNASVLNAMVAGMITGDKLTVVTDGVSANFITKNVGDAVKVLANGFSLTGEDATNYILKSTSFETTARIGKADLVIYTQNATKIYGDEDPGFSFVSDGLKAGDAISNIGRSNTSANVGNYEIDLYSLDDGNGGDNYNVVLNKGVLAITQKNITVTANAQSKVYGTDDPSLTYKVSGLVGSDTLTGELTRAAGEDVGTYAITQGTLAASSNYELFFTGANLTITKATVTVTADAQSKVYGTDDPSLTYKVSGLVGSDALTGELTRAAGENVGTYAISQGTLKASDNYNLIFNTANLTINKAKITISNVAATDREYNGGMGADVTFNQSGIIAGDEAKITLSVTGLFDDKNVGTDKAVSLTWSLTGDAAGNYELSGNEATATATITAKEISISGITAADKTYDGNDTTTVDKSAALLTGNVTGDDLDFTVTGLFADKNAATDKTVNLTVTLTGADKDNYVFAAGTQNTATATINKAQITISGITAANKTYDGNTTATLDYSNVIFGGIVGGDKLTVTATGVFESASAGTGKNVAISNLTLGGESLANYELAATGNQTETTATINKAALTVTAKDATITYGEDHSSILSSSYTVTGMVNGEAASVVTGAMGIENAANLSGAGKLKADATDLYKFTIGTLTAANYDITFVAQDGTDVKALTVNKFDLSATVDFAANKVYDGTTAVTVNSSSLNTVLANDTVNFNAALVYNDASVANANKIVSRTWEITGADAANYNLAAFTETAGTITAKSVELAWSSANTTYTYNGAVQSVTATYTDVTGTTQNVVVSFGDGVTFKNAGDYTATAAAVANYEFTNATQNLTINKLALTVTGASETVTYDGNVHTLNSVTPGDTIVSGHTVSTTATATGTDAGEYVLNIANAVIVKDAEGNDVTANYEIATTKGKLTINQKVLSVGDILADITAQTYDGDTTLDSATLTIDGVTISWTNAAFNSANVKDVATATFSGLTVDSNYALSADTVTVDAAGKITAKEISLGGLTVADKVYDGTKAAEITGIGFADGAIISGDTVTVNTTGATANFDSANAADSIKVTASGFTLSGTDAGNYKLISDSIETTAGISKATISVNDITAAITEQAYDGDTAVDAATLTVAGVGTDGTLTVNFTSGAFNSANVKDVATATFSGLSLANSNYQLSADTITVDAAGKITAKDVTLAWEKADSYTYTGADQSDTVKAYYTDVDGKTQYVDVTFNKTFRNAGDYTASAEASAADSNYKYTASSLDLTIAKAKITISNIAAVNREYNGGTGADVTFDKSGIVAADNAKVTLTVTGAFDNKNVGTDKAVSLTWSLTGEAASNYELSGNAAATTADITAKEITVSGITAGNKVYDGTTSATVDASGATFTGMISGDVLTVSTTGTFGDKNVGTGKTVTFGALTLGGADAGNYVLAATGNQSSVTADITAKEITVSGITASNKVYDSTTSATVDASGATFTGMISGDVLTVSTTGMFGDKNVGTGKTVTFGALTLGGADAGNYVLAATGNQSSVTADITAKEITVSGITAGNKVYDGTTSATVDTTDATFTGMITGDNLTVSTSGTFGDKNVGTGKTVTFGALTLGGTDAGNYIIADASQKTTTADITAKEISINGVTIADKIYDGNTSATITGATVSGVIGSDVVSVDFSGANANFVNANFGTGIQVNADGLALAGADSANYKLTSNAFETTGNITKATVTVTADAQSKVYGEADPTLTYNVTGLVGSDALTGELSRDAGENVGTYAITQGTLKASDNYDLVFNGANLTITKATVTVTADTQSKVYGKADPTLSYQVSGLVGNDVLTGELTRDAGENVGTYAITQGTLKASDNYDLVFNGANLTITKATVTVTADAQSKVYGKADPSLTYQVSGLVGSDVLTGELSRDAGKNVGTYAITQGTLKASDNYDLVFNGANLTITKATVTVTANAQSKVYGEADPPLSYQVSGLVGSDALTGKLIRDAGEDVGTYAITQGTLRASSNYILNYLGATFVITAKDVTPANPIPGYWSNTENDSSSHHYCINGKTPFEFMRDAWIYDANVYFKQKSYIPFMKPEANMGIDLHFDAEPITSSMKTVFEMQGLLTEDIRISCDLSENDKRSFNDNPPSLLLLEPELDIPTAAVGHHEVRSIIETLEELSVELPHVEMTKADLFDDDFDKAFYELLVI